MPGHSCKRFTDVFNTRDVLYIQIKLPFYERAAFFIISVKYIELCMGTGYKYTKEFAAFRPPCLHANQIYRQENIVPAIRD